MGEQLQHQKPPFSLIPLIYHSEHLHVYSKVALKLHHLYSLQTLLGHLTVIPFKRE